MLTFVGSRVFADKFKTTFVALCNYDILSIRHDPVFRLLDANGIEVVYGAHQTGPERIYVEATELDRAKILAMRLRRTDPSLDISFIGKLDTLRIYAGPRCLKFLFGS